MTGSDIHTVGSKLWIKDDKEVWAKAEVLKLEDGGKLLVRSETGQELAVVAAQTHLQNPDSRGIDVSMQQQ